MIFKPHTTVATIVENDGRFLFVEERVRGELVLNQPSGHLEADESLLAAARRETLEETGCRVEPSGLVGIYQWQDRGSGRCFLRFTFAAALCSHDPAAVLDDGIERMCWLTRSELEAQTLPLRSPVITRSLADYAAGRGGSLSLLNWIES